MTKYKYPQTPRIKELVEQMIVMLEKEDKHWAKYFTRQLEHLDKNELEAIIGMESCYRGMGSFNDICPSAELSKVMYELLPLTKEVIGEKPEMDVKKDREVFKLARFILAILKLGKAVR